MVKSGPAKKLNVLGKSLGDSIRGFKKAMDEEPAAKIEGSASKTPEEKNKRA